MGNELYLVETSGGSVCVKTHPRASEAAADDGPGDKQTNNTF